MHTKFRIVTIIGKASLYVNYLMRDGTINPRKDENMDKITDQIISFHDDSQYNSGVLLLTKDKINMYN